jgi:hypothetical protein
MAIAVNSQALGPTVHPRRHPLFTLCCFAGLTALRGYLLPPPAPVLNLFYALGCLLGYAPAQLQNVCGDPDWEAIQQVGLFVACVVW